MIAPLSLSNVMTVGFAVLALFTISAQGRGRVVKLWRLALPPAFAAVEAFILLAGVFEVTMLTDGAWLAAAIVGGLLGRMRGWTIDVQVDQRQDLVRQRPTVDGMMTGLALVVLSLIDFVSAARLDPVVEPHYVASGAAFCAGYLGCRALAIAARAVYLPHVELSVA
jgi:hypothetical protein